MFQGLSAWFSSSVNKKKRKLWVSNGGTEAPLDSAQYIFSQDPSVKDTERIFESNAYLDEHVAVFHPNYICECVKQNNMKAVVLGKYFFPPKDIQEIARQQVNYEWDKEGHISDNDSVHSESDEGTPVPQMSVIQRAAESSNKAISQHCSKDGQEMLMNKTAVSLTVDPQPGPSHQCSHVGPETLTQTLKQNDAQKSKQHKNQLLQTSPRKPNDITKRKHDTNQELSSGPVNKKGQSNVLEPRCKQTRIEVLPANKLTTSSSPRKQPQRDTRNILGIRNDNQPSVDKKGMKELPGQLNHDLLRLEDLVKVDGELQDFIIGQDGCELVKIS